MGSLRQQPGSSWPGTTGSDHIKVHHVQAYQTRPKQLLEPSFSVVLSQGLGLGPPRNGHHPRLFDPLQKTQICKQKANKSQPIQPQGWVSSKAFAQRFLPWKWIVPWYCWWFRNPAHQLRVVIYPMFLRRVLAPFQVVGKTRGLNHYSVEVTSWSKFQVVHTAGKFPKIW